MGDIVGLMEVCARPPVWPDWEKLINKWSNRRNDIASTQSQPPISPAPDQLS